jgi:hypothetical protein
MIPPKILCLKQSVVPHYLLDQKGRHIANISFFNLTHPADTAANYGYSLESLTIRSPKFHFKAGVIIKNNEGDLIHGISGMDFAQDSLLMISDWRVSILYDMRLSLDEHDVLKGLTLHQYSGLFHIDGHKIDPLAFDAEEITVTQSGQAYISTENVTNKYGEVIETDSIYQIDFAPNNFGHLLNKVDVPPEFSGFASNGGVEAFVVFKANKYQDRFIAFEEGALNATTMRVFVWDSEDHVLQKQKILPYIPEFGLHPVSACFVSANELLVLERGSQGWSVGQRAKFTVAIKYMKLSAAGIGFHFVDTEILAIIDPDTYSGKGIAMNDNFESIAVREMRVGNGYEVYVASDDNISPFQDNILLQFHLDYYD